MYLKDIPAHISIPVILNPLVMMLIVAGSLYSSADAQIDYATQVQPIFDDKCTSCHYDGLSGVTLSSYRTTMNSVGEQYEMSIVTAGEPDNSPLIDKIEPDPEYGSRMPQTGTLTQAQIDTIRQWVAEGALEEPATAIEGPGERPRLLKLHGNYPNPFNPATRIEVTLGQTVDLELRITGLDGKVIRTITRKSVQGNVTIPVTLANQSSGVYFYKVTARQNNMPLQQSVGRMLLIK